ncbi:alpha/beta hydrolase [uncultured Draconibacterium sp.]|uniref:alpha/beta fold hydrolase n=1 Tax=uncultured Draconibacterium sp. TaxID=1573823 RepID=UPI002AA76841|nr:alpha/beta hydrolase [uncultured Draconibacterium sp.]
MAYFVFKNKKVFYRTIGKGEPLLLLHGNTMSSKLFVTLTRKYAKYFKVILVDFPGHGKSERVEKFETDFWYYNSEVIYVLIQELKLEKVSVVGTSGGALVAINLALEHPECMKYLIADSFEGEFPLTSYVETIEKDRETDKKKLLAKVIWWYCHGSDWEKVVDLDTNVNIEFYKTGKSFFHKSISALQEPALITGSRKDEYCDHLDKIYGDLKNKNQKLEIHLFEQGGHPAMITNTNAFLEIIIQKIFQV